jgi:hypothetical protein
MSCKPTHGLSYFIGHYFNERKTIKKTEKSGRCVAQVATNLTRDSYQKQINPN